MFLIPVKSWKKMQHLHNHYYFSLDSINVLGISAPHLFYHLIYGGIDFREEHFILCQSFFIFLKELGRLKEFLVKSYQLELQSQWACIFLRHVGRIESFVIVEEVKDGEIAANKSSIFHKHILQRDQLFISGNLYHFQLQLFDALLAQMFFLNLFQAFEQSMQDNSLPPNLFCHDLSHQNGVLQRFAQQVGAIKLKTAVLNNREQTSNYMIFMNEIWQALDIDIELFDDLWFQVAIECHKDLIEFNADFQQNTAYHLGISSRFEVDECWRLAFQLVHDQKDQNYIPPISQQELKTPFYIIFLSQFHSSWILLSHPSLREHQTICFKQAQLFYFSYFPFFFLLFKIDNYAHEDLNISHSLLQPIRLYSVTKEFCIVSQLSNGQEELYSFFIELQCN